MQDFSTFMKAAHRYAKKLGETKKWGSLPYRDRLSLAMKEGYKAQRRQKIVKTGNRVTAIAYRSFFGDDRGGRTKSTNTNTKPIIREAFAA